MRCKPAAGWTMVCCVFQHQARKCARLVRHPPGCSTTDVMFLSASSLDAVTAIMFSAALEALQQLHPTQDQCQWPPHAGNMVGGISDSAGCLGLQCDTNQPCLQQWQVGALALLSVLSRMPDKQEA
jgi:hypothetical protein